MICENCGKDYIDATYRMYCSNLCWYLSMKKQGLKSDYYRLPNGRTVIKVKKGHAEKMSNKIVSCHIDTNLENVYGIIELENCNILCCSHACFMNLIEEV